ncbi:putative ribonuclease H-like domain-containing protein [Tanacetum coccineum]
MNKLWETLLEAFITEIENQLDYKVKVIRSDNGTEFNNSVMNQLCEIKGIKREFSVARTPQQNVVTERRNRTLIDAARTMLVDSKLPTTFWAEAVNTAWCDRLGKFDGKVDEGFFVGYSVVSKAMKVFNKRTMIVEETLNIRFLENAPNVTRDEPDWLFDVDSLTISMNYVPVVAGNQTNGIAGTKDNIVAGQAEKKTEPEQEYILIPFCTTDPLISQGPKDSEEDVGMKPIEVNESGASDKGWKRMNKTQEVSLKGYFNRKSRLTVLIVLILLVHLNAYDDEDVGAEADLNNLETTMNVSPLPTTKIDKDHPKDQIIRDLNSAIQTRRMTKISDEHAMVSYINKQRRTNHKDYQNCLFACFLSQKEPKKVIQALEDPSWVEAMQEELLQFKLQKVWTLVDLPNGKRAIGTKWVFRNKKDETGIVVRNKARLVAQGYTQEEGIDYDDVFSPVARIKAIKLFLAYASFMGQQALQYKTNKALVKDEEAEAIDVNLYRSMIGSLMYLTASRPDIMFVVCACARFKVTSKTLHIHAMKRIFGYLKGLSLKSGLGLKLWTSAKVKTVNGERQIQVLVDKKKVIISETSIRSDLKLDDAEGINSYFSSQWKFLIHTILQCLSAKTTPWNEFSSTMASAIICLATNQKFNLSKYIYDNMVKNLDGGVKFLIYPRFVQVFLDKQVQGMSKHKGFYVTPFHTKKVFANMKRPCKEDVSKQGRKIKDLDANAEVTLVTETQERNDEEMLFDIHDDLQGEEVVAEEVIAEKEVSTTDPVTTAGEGVTTANVEIKAAKPKAVTTIATTITSASTRPKAKGIAKDKGKAIMIEPERPLKKKDQVALDEEMARNLEAQLQAELIEEERITRQKEEEANIALIESWDNTQAIMEADFELAQRL